MGPKPDGSIRVLLIDRHSIVLWGLRTLIEREQPAMQVVGTATGIAEALSLAHDHAPDVVVLDSALLGPGRAADIPSLVNGRNARVLIFSGARDSALHEAAILAGACGVVHKDESPEVLVKAIAMVHQGQLWLDRSTTGRIFVELSRQKNGPAEAGKRNLSLLTEREQEVVRSLVTEPGADNKKLAHSLHIGEHTLRNHLSRIYDKLGVPNRLELYVFAQRHGIGGQPRV